MACKKTYVIMYIKEVLIYSYPFKFDNSDLLVTTQRNGTRLINPLNTVQCIIKTRNYN